MSKFRIEKWGDSEGFGSVVVCSGFFGSQSRWSREGDWWVNLSTGEVKADKWWEPLHAFYKASFNCMQGDAVK